MSEVCVATQDQAAPESPLFQTTFRRGDCIRVLPDGAFWGTKVELHSTWVIFKVPSEPAAAFDDMLVPVEQEVSVVDVPVPAVRRTIEKLRKFFFALDTLTFMQRKGVTPFVALTAPEGLQLLASKTLRP